eukprot:515604-Hanusia_phi.AAC.1
MEVQVVAVETWGCKQLPGSAQQGATFWNGSTYLPGGYAGGVSSACSRGAGGGGAAEPGNTVREGDGGNGRAVDITGTLTYYAGGGQGCYPGGSYSNVRGSLGGGGYGPTSSGGTNGANGQAHTGGGAGGMCDCASPFNAGLLGGSGIVIIRYSSTVGTVSSDATDATKKAAYRTSFRTA